MIAPRIKAVIEADQGILDAFGARVVQADQGECVIASVVPDHMVNAAGFAHGSMAFALLDTACAYALGTLGTPGVTTNANVSYVGAAQAGSELEARVQVLSRSRRVATLRGELKDTRTGKLCAHGSFVFQLRPAQD